MLQNLQVRAAEVYKESKIGKQDKANKLTAILPTMKILFKNENPPETNCLLASMFVFRGCSQRQWMLQTLDIDQPTP